MSDVKEREHVDQRNDNSPPMAHIYPSACGRVVELGERAICGHRKDTFAGLRAWEPGTRAGVQRCVVCVDLAESNR